ncbi:hypothetical protein DV737_g459, partial [Chaetothyriales sp. CBS 132003]
MATDELIDFEIIENSKENIQPLREGRSAKALAAVLSPNSSARPDKEPTLYETKTLNDAIRAEYEIELQSIEDSDDPLDIYDRYVKWTLNAYPSAQATRQSQLLPLLERATKAFLTTSHYRNDPRYLKLWLHYIRLFSDAPRETFAFLARHHIGDTLGLFYEEFAAWLESAGRWNQAAEVYEMGIQKEARPAERLLRKYSQFQQRFDARPQEPNEPSSPALPTVRPALAAKVDPFAPAATTSEHPQAAQTQAAGARTAGGRSGKPKMAIFSDANDAASQPAHPPSQGWDSIGSIKERKKENTIEARPWAGETLKAGGRVGKTPRMEVFKDPRPFVCMEAIYPNEHEEFSFEELRAMHRGWSQRDWKCKQSSPLRTNGLLLPEADTESMNERFQQNLSVVDNSTQSPAGMPPPRMKPKRLKVREVKQEAQTVKTRLESPTGPKMRKKNSAEPTMTFHSKAATNEIYDMFNRPLKNPAKEEAQSREDSDYDDTYSTAGESTGTGPATSVFGDDTLGSVVHSGREDNTCSQPDSISSWSDFTTSKHVPQVKKKHKHQTSSSLDLTEHMNSSQNPTQTSGLDGAFDTQAIAAIANQNLDDLDTRAIALIAGSEADEETQETEDLKAEAEDSHPQEVEITHKPRFVAIPPEDYEPTPLRPYRDPVAAAQNKLPFMTPIAEQTESTVAPSTLWKDADYFKTPSRPANGRFDSPSKLQPDELLMSSPAKEPCPRSPVKSATEKELLLMSSPAKEPSPRSPVKGATEKGLLISSPEKKQRDAPPTSVNEQPRHIAEASFKEDIKAPPPSKRQTQAVVAKTVTTDPIINDAQCNPCDRSVREQILKAIQPPISSYAGFTDCSSETFGHASILRAYTDKVAKQKPGKFSPRKSQCDKSRPVPTPQLNFKGSSRIYAVKRELGKGAFAPVYLVDSSERDEDENGDGSTVSERCHGAHTTTRGALEALKSECPPETLVWEFHILRLIRSRLPPSSRTLQSLISAHECHLYRDECYLLLSYAPQGTLLDLVNHFRSANASAGKQIEGTGMDEMLVMFFTVELLRTMAALHSIGILHGDLKADNSLVRLDPAVNLTSPYSPTGAEGWSAKGLTLIDFGRGIDTTNFPTRTRFIADWDPQPEDCVEIRECKPWKWQIDFYGAAGVIHSMLFGKYLATHEYRVKEAFKRYWERNTWEHVFSVLLNRGGAGGAGQLDDGVRTEHLHGVISRLEATLLADGERLQLFFGTFTNVKCDPGHGGKPKPPGNQLANMPSQKSTTLDSTIIRS